MAITVVHTSNGCSVPGKLCVVPNNDWSMTALPVLVVALEISIRITSDFYLPIWIIHSKNCMICVCVFHLPLESLLNFAEALKRIAKSFVIGQPNKQLPQNKGQRCTGTRIYGRHRRNACARPGCWAGCWHFFPPSNFTGSGSRFTHNFGEESWIFFEKKTVRMSFFDLQHVGTVSVFSWWRQNLRVLGQLSRLLAKLRQIQEMNGNGNDKTFRDAYHDPVRMQAQQFEKAWS